MQWLLTFEKTYVKLLSLQVISLVDLYFCSTPSAYLQVSATSLVPLTTPWRVRTPTLKNTGINKMELIREKKKFNYSYSQTSMCSFTYATQQASARKGGLWWHWPPPDVTLLSWIMIGYLPRERWDLSSSYLFVFFKVHCLHCMYVTNRWRYHIDVSIYVPEILLLDS